MLFGHAWDQCCSVRGYLATSCSFNLCYILLQTKICDFGMSRVLEEAEAMMSLNVASRRVPYAW